MPELAELTPEEEAEFTVFNAGAYDLYRMECGTTDTVPACWLCMSVEDKTEIRQKFAVWLAGALYSPVPYTVEQAEQVAKRQFGNSIDHKVKLWRNMEAELKQLRAEGNPRAFFAG